MKRLDIEKLKYRWFPDRISELEKCYAFLNPLLDRQDIEDEAKAFFISHDFLTLSQESKRLDDSVLKNISDAFPRLLGTLRPLVKDTEAVLRDGIIQFARKFGVWSDDETACGLRTYADYLAFWFCGVYAVYCSADSDYWIKEGIDLFADSSFIGFEEFNIPDDELVKVGHELISDPKSLLGHVALTGISLEEYASIDKKYDDTGLASQAQFLYQEYNIVYLSDSLIYLSEKLLKYRLFEEWVSIFDGLSFSCLQVAWVSSITDTDYIKEIVGVSGETDKPLFLKALLLHHWFDREVFALEQFLSNKGDIDTDVVQNKCAETIMVFCSSLSDIEVIKFISSKRRFFPTETNHSKAYAKVMEASKSALTSLNFQPDNMEIGQLSFYQALGLASVYLDNETINDETLRALADRMIATVDEMPGLQLDNKTLSDLRIASSLLARLNYIDEACVRQYFLIDRVIFEGWRVKSISETYATVKREALLYAIFALMLESDGVVDGEAKAKFFTSLLDKLLVQVNTCDNMYIYDNYYRMDLFLMGLIASQILNCEELFADALRKTNLPHFKVEELLRQLTP